MTAADASYLSQQLTFILLCASIKTGHKGIKYHADVFLWRNLCVLFTVSLVRRRQKVHHNSLTNNYSMLQNLAVIWWCCVNQDPQPTSRKFRSQKYTLCASITANKDNRRLQVTKAAQSEYLKRYWCLRSTTSIECVWPNKRKNKKISWDGRQKRFLTSHSYLGHHLVRSVTPWSF